MEEPERPGAAPDPPATHWNVPRDPKWSFDCPRCGRHVVLKPIIRWKEYPGGERYEDISAFCMQCPEVFIREIWEYYKAMELLQQS